MTPFDLVHAPLAPGLTLLEASAGTGKTYTISRLAVRLLLEGLSMADLLVVTFTRAATAELAERIRATVREAHDHPEDATFGALIAASGRSVENAQAHLAQALREADLLGVTTIHAFAKRVLEDAAFESRQPFATTLVTDEDALIDGALTDLWRTVLAESPALAVVAHAQGWRLEDDRHLLNDFLRFPATTVVHGLELPAAEAAWRTAIAGLAAAWDVEAFLAATATAGWTQKAPTWVTTPDARESTLRAVEPTRPDAALLAVVPLLANPDAHGLGKKSKVEKAAREAVLALPVIAAANAVATASHDLLRAWRTHLLATLPAQVAEAKATALARSTDDLLRQVNQALPSPDAPLATVLRERHRVVLIDEFQDTDPVQWRIFHTVFGHSPAHRLVLVGDPKQAIYGFRGGDLGTYTAAAAAVPPAQRFTLGTNYRSEPALLADLNACFASVPAPTFVTPEPAFHPVAAGNTTAVLHGWDGPRLRFWTEDDLVKKHDYAGRVATRIVHLLHHGLRIAKDGVARDLAPGDIAVLVNSHAQAQELQDACHQRGLPAVLARSGDVLSGDEARDLAAVLQACLTPRRAITVRTALATRLMGRDAAALQALEAQPTAWDAVVAHFTDLGHLLLRRGPLAVVDRLVHEADGLRSRPDAARRLTDLRHLAELAQARHDEGADAEAVVRWLSGGGADEEGRDERQRRLESDARALQITTLHSSKGLEWPVVLCPYLSEPPKEPKGEWIARRAADGNGLLDVAPDDLDAAESLRDRVAEQARLLYVALTRASHLCLVQAGRFNRAAKTSALAWLLRPTEQAAWGTWAADPLRREVATEAFPLPDDTTWQGIDEARVVVEPPVLPTVPAARDHTSFSRLTRDADASERGEDHDAEPPEPTTTETDVLADFPRGTTGGTALHACLERWDLATAHAPAQLGRILAEHGLDPHLGSAVAALQTDLAASVVPGLGTLAELAHGPRRAELRFTLTCAHLDGPALARVFAAHGQAAYAHRLARLPHGAMPGYCVGAIDLVLGAPDDRWWVIDWKSNRLDRPLETLMEEHHYPLQAHLYLVAVHRLLRQRRAAYNPAQHLGGWAYAFLRGVRPGTTSGWLTGRADAALILALDELLEGRHA